MACTYGALLTNNVKTESFITHVLDDESTDDSQNVGALAMQPPDATSSPRRLF
jgi:hypothetical protein